MIHHVPHSAEGVALASDLMLHDLDCRSHLMRQMGACTCSLTDRIASVESAAINGFERHRLGLDRLEAHVHDDDDT